MEFEGFCKLTSEKLEETRKEYMSTFAFLRLEEALMKMNDKSSLDYDLEYKINDIKLDDMGYLLKQQKQYLPNKKTMLKIANFPDLYDDYVEGKFEEIKSKLKNKAYEFVSYLV